MTFRSIFLFFALGLSLGNTWAVGFKSECERKQEEFQSDPQYITAQNLSRKNKDEDALKQFIFAANKNNLEAYIDVGLIYLNGWGNTPQNTTEGLKWIKSAAKRDYGPAQEALGSIYSLGIKVPMDYVEAANWYKLASGNSCIRSWLSLSMMYENGEGVRRDIVKSHMWRNLYNSVSEDQDREKLLKYLERNMTGQQISQAQKLARECQARNFKNCD